MKGGKIVWAKIFNNYNRNNNNNIIHSPIYFYLFFYSINSHCARNDPIDARSQWEHIIYHNYRYNYRYLYHNIYQFWQWFQTMPKQNIIVPAQQNNTTCMLYDWHTTIYTHTYMNVRLAYNDTTDVQRYDWRTTIRLAYNVQRPPH